MKKNWFRKENVLPASAYAVIITVFILVMVFWHPGQQAPTSYPSGTPEPVAAAPVKPQLPEAAKQPTKAGGEAFLQYFVEVHNYTMATGDTELFKQIVDKDSGFGKATVKEVEDDPESNKNLGIKLLARKTTFYKDSWVILVRVDYWELRDGKETSPDPLRADFIALFSEGRWTASELTNNK